MMKDGVFKEHRPHINGFIGHRMRTYSAALAYRGLFALAVLTLAARTIFYREGGEVDRGGEHGNDDLRRFYRSEPHRTAHIDGMCYGGKHAWSCCVARTRSMA
jgi:hypothetical protein